MPLVGILGNKLKVLKIFHMYVFIIYWIRRIVCILAGFFYIFADTFARAIYEN